MCKAGDANGGVAAMTATADNATATNATSRANAYVDASNSIITANDNTVNIQASTINGSVIGGIASLSAKAGFAQGGTANGTPILGYALMNIHNTILFANSNNITFDANWADQPDSGTAGCTGTCYRSQLAVNKATARIIKKVAT